MTHRGRLIVVGGHSRRIGKTTVVTTILAGLRDQAWAAIKISAHRHGSSLDCLEETRAGQESQAARYLDAGARRAFLYRVPDHSLPDAARRVEQLLAAGFDVIAESNRIVDWIPPDLVLFVVAPDVPDWKPSSKTCLDRASAIVVSRPSGSAFTAADVNSPLPKFRLGPSGEDIDGLAGWARCWTERIRERFTSPAGFRTNRRAGA